MQAQRTRLQQLQAQAETLSDLLQIEDSLTEVQSQIESWQSQLDWYSNQVQQCTVYIDLNEVQTYTPADEGFFSRIGTAFTSGWGNFVNGLQQLVVAQLQSVCVILRIMNRWLCWRALRSPLRLRGAKSTRRSDLINFPHKGFPRLGKPFVPPR